MAGPDDAESAQAELDEANAERETMRRRADAAGARDAVAANADRRNADRPAP